MSCALDALEAVTVIDGEVRIHHPQNLVLTSEYLNFLKSAFDVLLIRLVIELCRTPPDDKVKQRELKKRVDHLYLIRMQLPLERKKRLALDPNGVVLRNFQEQSRVGLANYDACRDSKSTFWTTFGSSGRRSRYWRPAASAKFPEQEMVEHILKQIEAASDVPIPRVDGVPYPYDEGSAPTSWQWWDLALIFSDHLNALTKFCNRHYITTCTVPALFLTHCIQYVSMKDPVRWIWTSMVPYSRHPFKASAGHAAHGLNMESGWPDEITSVDDFSWRRCNINFEPYVWNCMRGHLDHYYDDIVKELQESIPLDNPPYWRAELPALQDVPDLSYLQKLPGPKRKTGPKPGSRKTGSKKTGATKRASEKTIKEASAKTTRSIDSKKPGSSEYQVTSDKQKVPFATASLDRSKSPPYFNLSNDGNTCYASSILQCFFHVPALRAVLFGELPRAPRHRNAEGQFVPSRDWKGHKRVTDAMQVLITVISSAKAKLPKELVGGVVEQVRRLDIMETDDTDFKERREADAAQFFARICTILNQAGDRSWRSSIVRAGKVPPEDDPKTPTELDLEERTAIANKSFIQALRDDKRRNLLGHRSIGNDSELTETVGFQSAVESYCEAEACESPYSRSWIHGEILDVSFPPSSAKSYTLMELLEAYCTFVADPDEEGEEYGAVCQANPKHPRKIAFQKKLTHLPPLLAIRVQRLSLSGAYSGKSLEQLEGTAHFAMNKLEYDEILDLKELIQRKLPSEQDEVLGPMPTANVETRYELHAVIQYRNAHYVVYIRVADPLTGTLRWAIFNDSEEYVRWESPFDAEAGGRTGEFLLLYTRSTEMEAVKKAAAKTAKNVAEESDSLAAEATILASARGDREDNAVEISDEEESDDDDDEESEVVVIETEGDADDDFNPYGPDDDGMFGAPQSDPEAEANSEEENGDQDDRREREEKAGEMEDVHAANLVDPAAMCTYVRGILDEAAVALEGTEGFEQDAFYNASEQVNAVTQFALQTWATNQTLSQEISTLRSEQAASLAATTGADRPSVEEVSPTAQILRLLGHMELGDVLSVQRTITERLPGMIELHTSQAMAAAARPASSTTTRDLQQNNVARTQHETLLRQEEDIRRREDAIRQSQQQLVEQQEQLRRDREAFQKEQEAARIELERTSALRTGVMSRTPMTTSGTPPAHSTLPRPSRPRHPLNSEGSQGLSDPARHTASDVAKPGTGLHRRDLGAAGATPSQTPPILPTPTPVPRLELQQPSGSVTTQTPGDTSDPTKSAGFPVSRGPTYPSYAAPTDSWRLRTQGAPLSMGPPPTLHPTPGSHAPAPTGTAGATGTTEIPEFRPRTPDRSMAIRTTTGVHGAPGSKEATEVGGRRRLGHVLDPDASPTPPERSSVKRRLDAEGRGVDMRRPPPTIGAGGLPRMQTMPDLRSAFAHAPTSRLPVPSAGLTRGTASAEADSGDQDEQAEGESLGAGRPSFFERLRGLSPSKRAPRDSSARGGSRGGGGSMRGPGYWR